ncbi:type I-E CRISPR-associated protein Cse1/CasA [Geobacter sulfurreducens]|uniref:type I-E CRISPR-associated protein Cse1/CasA n=1 Tax=Geobacter sulfurreducens TaxID=35554 RepID=UPI002574316F|nr:type I-E CRISPR-associated protein Cse1/CasA [Geobacter sulfurreducens]BEH10634.1 type I-E CRISPR-associated protein Cse1/CasA [Geobacter sulfurreducens subsp. ethanolicus]HML79498.1 type I-E CRISPR-associated protein Cse1/CasA [Geobacter sulfurreducens]
MRKFNLVDEKWIPVRFLDGSRDELGISETLLRSSEIAVIEDPSPLVVAALHRFLLAVLYRALEGPTDIEQAKALFKAGLPGGRIKAYLEKWSGNGRFWLFDDKYPFGQVPSVPEIEAEPWTKLTAEHNATTSKVLFDHTDTKSLKPISLAAAAKWVVATLNFSVRGGRGYRPSPSADGIICIPIGKDLQQTLLCSLVPYPNRTMIVSDLPIWEREPSSYSEFKSGQERIAAGFADLYTWQARAMRLLQTSDGQVDRVAFIPGFGHVESELRDPMVPYMARRDTGIEQVGFEERGVWASFDSLLPDAGSIEGLEPKVINYLGILSRSRLVGAALPLTVIGQKFTNASVEFWRMERFTLPINISENRYLKSEIHELLSLANDAGDSLEWSLRELAKSMITKGDRELLPDKWVAGKLKSGDVTKFVKSTGVLPQYWTLLESHFQTVLSSYALSHSSESIRCDWLKSVHNALHTAWSHYSSSLSTGDAWAMRAVVKASKPTRVKLAELKEEIEKYS